MSKLRLTVSASSWYCPRRLAYTLSLCSQRRGQRQEGSLSERADKAEEGKGTVDSHLGFGNHPTVGRSIRSLRLLLCAYVQEGRTWILGIAFTPSHNDADTVPVLGLRRVADC